MCEHAQLIEFPYFSENSGDLVVLEGGAEVPFSIARVFNVRAPIGSVRGKHAHCECTQLLICTNGTVEVCCNDGSSTSLYVLDKPNLGLLVLPRVWAEQTYLCDDSVLTVLCDKPYDENDYIRDYQDFLEYIDD